jgi:hypothetical protein
LDNQFKIIRGDRLPHIQYRWDYGHTVIVYDEQLDQKITTLELKDASSLSIEERESKVVELANDFYINFE